MVARCESAFALACCGAAEHDTVGIKVGPFATVDLYGTPYSEALHVIERYRLIDGKAAVDAQFVARVMTAYGVSLPSPTIAANGTNGAHCGHY